MKDGRLSIPDLNEFDLPIPSGAGAGKRAMANVCTLLRSSVTKQQLDQIVKRIPTARAKGVYAGLADLPGEEPEVDDEEQDPDNKADALWRGFRAFAKGAVTKMSGDLLDDSFFFWIELYRSLRGCSCGSRGFLEDR